MKTIFSKLFCKHKWTSHAKTTTNWTDTKIVNGTAHWWNPKTMEVVNHETTEVLICSECGKITKIIY